MSTQRLEEKIVFEHGELVLAGEPVDLFLLDFRKLLIYKILGWINGVIEEHSMGLRCDCCYYGDYVIIKERGKVDLVDCFYFRVVYAPGKIEIGRLFVDPFRCTIGVAKVSGAQ